LFVRLSVNKAGVPKQMILVGVCEKCAAKDDATLLREGFAELRRAFPDMPEFKMQVIQEGSGRRALRSTPQHKPRGGAACASSLRTFDYSVRAPEGERMPTDVEGGGARPLRSMLRTSPEYRSLRLP